jgi:preprotein translocase subunit SecG
VGKSDIPWMPYIMAVLFAIIIIAVNFIPSKRGHQD